MRVRTDEFAGFDESEEMLAELPISLRLQLDLVLNRDLFLKVPFFKSCDTSFLTVMVPRIHREYTWWGKTVRGAACMTVQAVAQLAKQSPSCTCLRSLRKLSPDRARQRAEESCPTLWPFLFAGGT